MEYEREVVIGKQKNIALIAHDNKKQDMLDWCKQNEEILKKHFAASTAALSAATSR